MNAPDEQSFIQLLNSEDYDFRFECGVGQPITTITINHRDEIVDALAMHSIFSIKAELDQMISGLNDYGMGELAQNNPEMFRQLFVHYRQLPLTADILFDLFPAKFSSPGSNARETEEAALMHWIHYTQDVYGEIYCKYIASWPMYMISFVLDCNGVLEVVNPKDQERERFHISLQSIMIFATGMAEEPPMGFDPQPSLLFHNDHLYPRANTCGNEVSIPTGITSYDEFAYNASFGIINSAGFGQL